MAAWGEEVVAEEKRWLISGVREPSGARSLPGFMHIDAVLTPAEIALLPQRDLSGATCVVFDVLRATSSMITALAHGAVEIHPVCTIEEALALQQRIPDSVLGGERNGDLIPGFEVGNSPLEYREMMTGRKIITTTTNGTVALRACEHAERVLVGALLNIAAVAAELQAKSAAKVLLVCAGTFETFALEDAYAAGLLIGLLGEGTTTDAALTVRAMSAAFSDPLAALRSARNGQVLAASGRAADVEWCAQVSKYNVVGQMNAGVIRLLTA
jgi:2-phosphosulfolactate phosphatase